MNNNLDTLLAAGKAAIAAKNELKQRIAENDEDWNKTSNLVKDIWAGLELRPHDFKIAAVTFTCDDKGITQKEQSEHGHDPKMLVSLQDSIKEYLDRIRLSYDEKMQP